jgi:hypothetical protein
MVKGAVRDPCQGLTTVSRLPIQPSQPAVRLFRMPQAFFMIATLIIMISGLICISHIILLAAPVIA